MKKVFSILLIIAMLLNFCSCQQGGLKDQNNSNASVGNQNGGTISAGNQNGATTSIGNQNSATSSVGNLPVVTKNLSVSELNTQVKGTKKRSREKANGTRMLINNENPMFLFRSAQGYSSTNSYFDTYYSLPDDIKAFSAICVDVGINAPINQLLRTYENILTRADKENIPVFLMTEVWDSQETREGFTQEQLENLLKNHPSLMGFVHVELCCEGWTEEGKNRIKTTIKACKQYDALFIWQDMEYPYDKHNNTFNRAFEDSELYKLMTDYAHNIVIQDKHNGDGRHFSVQSSAMGAWLAGACGNWGGNIEGWIWQEVVPYDYEKNIIKALKYREFQRYPSSLAGIDLFCDAIGGATVFSTEGLSMFYITRNGVAYSEVFWSVVYPIFQRILNGAVPDKKEVVKNIKVAYQFTSPEDRYMQDIESDIFIDTYGMTLSWFNLRRTDGKSRKWLPITGRYYIIPLLPKHANASKILPNADILNAKNYQQLVGSPSKKKKYFNDRYPETYTGDATLYSINGLTYIFNNCEYKQNIETANYSLKTSKLNLSTSLDMHTYMILEEKQDGVNIDLVNLRLDTYDVTEDTESSSQFESALIKGGKMDRKEDRRTTTIALKGLSKMPDVKVAGNNNATAKVEFNPNTKTATITIISNGAVKINVKK